LAHNAISMPRPRLHIDEVDIDEVDIDEPLVLGLLTDQFPSGAELPLERFDSSGTVNAIYRKTNRVMVANAKRIVEQVLLSN